MYRNNSYLRKNSYYRNKNYYIKDPNSRSNSYYRNLYNKNNPYYIYDSYDINTYYRNSIPFSWFLLKIRNTYYYYYYNNYFPFFFMIIYRLIIFIDFLWINSSCIVLFLNVFLDNYIIDVSCIDTVLSVYPLDNISYESVTNNFPSDGMTETQHRIEFDKIEFDFKEKKRYDPRGPSFHFRHILDYFRPEKYHIQAKYGTYIDNDTVRMYNEKPFKYYYHSINNQNSLIFPEIYHVIKHDGHCKIEHSEGISGNNGFCIIMYPDGTYIDIKSPETVFRHIHYHQKNVYINKESPTDYVKWYKLHFMVMDQTRMERPRIREKITINELLNP